MMRKNGGLESSRETRDSFQASSDWKIICGVHSPVGVRASPLLASVRLC